MAGNTLLLVGSGPGIATSVSTLFSSKSFTRIYLIARNINHLERDRATILAELNPERRQHVEVETFVADVLDATAYKAALGKVKQASGGTIDVVVYNAARVAPSSFFETDIDAWAKDFQTTTTSLFTTASSLLPFLTAEENATQHPCFFVTSSLISVQPNPDYFALSTVKASQRSLTLSLQTKFPNVHISLINVNGRVERKGDGFLRPDEIAVKFWELWLQGKSGKEAWAGEVNFP
ncbi:hypothetical protein BGZ60DRAFT_414291 [Tricladium varicosporioides]|nr:hypothetical protein BGZ60DRAFT_414291 [Hymenoscyphus varicosporioides]